MSLVSRVDDYFDSFEDREGERKPLKLQALVNSMNAMAKEVKAPHVCSRHCPCLLIKVHLEIMEAQLRRIK